ncbi:flagellar biosynthesis protein [Cohnella kolymensis]|uniref:Flagellar biosynthesis protein n=1 Tax=Cohnella kolymensis TaxID=1590652 RepID=A0ABR5A2X6_9BACL|nr:FliH/SctL family protein [Cohnella kolymensis]KIL35287.1 flagellar biosynthesis protein [Cohnella kolymensis]
MSNLIKSSHVVSLEDLKRLEIIQRISPKQHNISETDASSGGDFAADVETHSLKQRILQDAEQAAYEIMRQAQAEAAEMRAAAEREIEAWWLQRREQDERHLEEAQRSGFEEGYRIGTAQAEQDLTLQWDNRIKEAEEIIEQAYAAKESVISEAETFVVDLSCSIAEKIVGNELQAAPATAISMYMRALSRRKEQGAIVLCVSPSQFAYVQAAKDELILALDSQAELQIVPDSTIKEGGCIVRSAFGSIDARIDTQLEAVRQELLRVAAQSAEEGIRDAAP